MRILLTGATSLAGRRLYRLLRQQGHDVTGVSRRAHAGDGFCRVDLESPDAPRLLPDGPFDALIHFASLVPLNERASVWGECSRANLHGTARLLEWADRRVRRVLLASSCAVYGQTLRSPADESHPLRPESPYAITKYGQEQLFQAFCRARDIPLLVLRLGYVYGPDMPDSRIVVRFIKKALAGEAITLKNSRTTGMNLIHQDDIARITAALLENGRGTFNLGGGSFVSLHDYVEAVMSATGRRTSVTCDDTPGAPVTGHFSSALAARYGLKPEVSLHDAIQGIMAAAA